MFDQKQSQVIVNALNNEVKRTGLELAAEILIIVGILQENLRQTQRAGNGEASAENGEALAGQS